MDDRKVLKLSDTKLYVYFKTKTIGVAIHSPTTIYFFLILYFIKKKCLFVLFGIQVIRYIKFYRGIDYKNIQKIVIWFPFYLI